MTNEELDLQSIRYTEEFDAERPSLYANNHEREVREAERQQAYQDGFREALDFASGLVNKKQEQAVARWRADGRTSDSGIANVAGELLRELTLTD